MYRLFIVQFVILLVKGYDGQRLPDSVRRPPSITFQSNESHYVVPGKEIVVQCVADALPKVNKSEYYWKKDGEYFNISQLGEGNKSVQILMSSMNGTIFFKGSDKLRYKDRQQYGGKYQCFASNKWGTAMSTEIDVKIAYKAPAYKIPDTVKQEVREGDPLVLSCDKDASEDADIDWFIGEERASSERVAETPDGKIVFSNVQKSDAGPNVYCNFKYIPTRSSIEGTYYILSVKSEEIAEDGPPVIFHPKRQGETQLALKDGEVRLTCVAKGKPTPSISWERKGKEFLWGDDEEDEDRFQTEEFGRTLLITGVKYEDAGTYTCTATNGEDSRKRDAELVVEAKPYFTDDTRRPTNMIKLPGTFAIIRCDPDGKPEPEVTWLKNGKPIDDSDSETARDNELLLQDLTESDTGVYQCIGENKHGTILGQGYLNVLTSPPVPQSDNVLQHTTVEKKSITISCEMFAAPPHTITWRKINQTLKRNLLDDERISLKKDKALTIESVHMDDSGVYECTGTNKYGASSINITLKILSKTKVDPLYNVYKATKGSSVTMSVVPETDVNLSNPIIKWYKGGYQPGTGISLTLQSVDWEDEGAYTIVVQTELDGAQTTIELIVQDVPDKPLRLMFTPDENDPYSGTLNWERPNDNNSPISGYVVEQRASGMYQGHWQPITPAGSEPQSSVTELEPWVTYIFRVWAENEIGRSRNASYPTDPYRTPSEAPRVNPSGVTGMGTSPDNMIISWDPVDPIKYAGPEFGYEVSWCLESNCSWKEVFCDLNTTSYTVTGTPTYARYLIKVRSSNINGSGPEPETLVGYSGEDVPSEPPSKVRFKMDNDSKIVVSWEPVPEEKMRGLPTGYKITANEIDPYKMREPTLVGPDETSRELQLESYTDYEITIAVMNNAGNSDPSVPIILKTPEGVPDAPENFTASGRKLNSFKLEWKDPSKVKGIIESYRLQYEWTEGNESKSEDKSTDQKKMRLENLIPGTSYNLTLCAKTSRGFGDDCAKLMVTTLAGKKPRETIYEVVTDEFLRANITWEKSEDDSDEGVPVRLYRIEHRLAGNEKDWESADEVKVLPEDWSFNYTVENLTAGTMYEFRIVAKNEYGETYTNSTMKKTPGAQYRTADAGIIGKLWFILLLCIAAIIVFVIVIACFVRRRKGGKYAVSEKEEQLVKLEAQPMNNEDSGKYTSANEGAKDPNGPLIGNDEPDRPLRLRGDSVGGNSIEVFGSGDTREYDEDGSFIDQYGVRSQSKSEGVSSPVSDDSKDIGGPQTRLLSDSDRGH